MIVKLLTEHHLKYLSLKGGCRGSSESTHVKMPHCWKLHALAHIIFTILMTHVYCMHILSSEGLVKPAQLSCVMRFPTMWYVPPAKAQTSLCMRAV